MSGKELVAGIKKPGFGYMCLPQKDGGLDIELLNQLADKYLAAGFSYFDTSPCTAWASLRACSAKQC